MIHICDESKFNLFGSNGKSFVRHVNGKCLSHQCIKKTVKFGVGRVMVWGKISSAEVGPIVRLHGNINASVYKEYLHQHVLPHLCKGAVKIPIFMQDNALCHKAKTVLSVLEEKRIPVMKWPPQSPDMNPIENVWKIIGEKAQIRNPQNIDDLQDFLKKNGKYQYHLFVRS